MAQINLLKHSATPEQNFSGISAILSKLLIVVLVLAVGYYGYLYFQLKSKAKETADIQQQIAQDKQDPEIEKQRRELVTRQSQLKHLDTLLANHVYWTNLLPVLATSTLKNVNYTSLRALTDGTITLNADAPSHAELDKFLQVFNNPEVNKNFKDVRIGGISKEKSEGANPVIKFEVRMKYNPQLIKYK